MKTDLFKLIHNWTSIHILEFKIGLTERIYQRIYRMTSIGNYKYNSWAENTIKLLI